MDAVRRRILGVAVVLAATFALLLLLLLLAGYPPGDALGAFARGALVPDALGSATAVRAVPLALTGLAVAVAFTAGVWNIGAEGQLLMGATVATATALAIGPELGRLALPLVLAAAAVAGAAWAGIAAALRRWFGVLEVISTIMLNFVALHLVGLLVRGPLQEPQRIYPQSPTIPAGSMLPPIPGLGRLHWGALIAVVAAAAAWWILRHRAGGFRVRAAGANPVAAAVAGEIDVPRVTMRAFLVSGALAGLAGAVEVSGVTFALYESLSPGYGYVAIAVALLAGLRPLGVLGAALLFGALEAGGTGMQRDAGVPSVIVTIVEALLIFGVVTAIARRGAASVPVLAPPAPEPGERAA